MTHEQKITYLSIAANICSFGFKKEHTDLLVCLYEAVMEKGGELDLRSISVIQSECEARNKSRLLDKFSEKV